MDGLRPYRSTAHAAGMLNSNLDTPITETAAPSSAVVIPISCAKSGITGIRTPIAVPIIKFEAAIGHTLLSSFSSSTSLWTASTLSSLSIFSKTDEGFVSREGFVEVVKRVVVRQLPRCQVKGRQTFRVHFCLIYSRMEV